MRKGEGKVSKGKGEKTKRGERMGERINRSELEEELTYRKGVQGGDGKEGKGREGRGGKGYGSCRVR